MSQMVAIWQASIERKQTSSMQIFLEYAETRTRRHLSDWSLLYKWSIEETAEFWGLVSDFCHIKWLTPPTRTYSPPPPGKMLGAKWFCDAKLNYAENLLSNLAPKACIVSLKENAAPVVLDAHELIDEVARCRSFLLQVGIKKGDAVAAVCINDHQIVVAMLACAALGAVFSSCSPDFGVQGIIDRLALISPKVVFFSSHYSYNGKIIDCKPNAKQVLDRLGKNSLGVVIGVFEHLDCSLNGFYNWQQDIRTQPVTPLEFVPCAFDDPLFIMFSSGTTGVPKAILHSVGGTLLQHKKELMLHSDIKAGDGVGFYTTCGWMMWNWITSSLALGARLICYDGSPAYPDLNFVWQMIDTYAISAFGTSPKFLTTLRQNQVSPKKEAKLSSLRTLWSTGSPLSPELFHWVYEHIKEDLHLGSISGGTDILSCFMLANPLLEVYPGYIQGPGLGMAIEAWDEKGVTVHNKEGELVCLKPFVSMPIGFLHDADSKKYRTAYFDSYSSREVWRHGDYISLDPKRGIMVLGRSDATLNPAGVRIGTSEIYRQIDKIKAIKDCLALPFKRDHDEEIVLTVQLHDGVNLTDSLKNEIKTCIQSNLTRRHVPAYIFAVTEIPYTRSGKKVESAASKALNGREIDNLEAIANPRCIEEYRKIGAELLQK